MAEPVEFELPHAHLDARVEGDGPEPAVVVLHGRGADETDLLPVARRLPDRLQVVSLRAPTPLGPGYTWYDLDLSGGDLHASQPDAADFERSLELAAASIEGAIDAYGLDGDRLGLLGFSQGAVTSFALLLEDPTVAWVVGLHGYLPDSHADREPDGIAGRPVFVGAGNRDEVIPATRAEAAADRLRAIGCAVRLETYQVGHGVGEAELDDVVGFVREQVQE